jgi:hypothetical protein
MSRARSNDQGHSWRITHVTNSPYGILLLALAARSGQIGVLTTENTDRCGDLVEELYTSTDDGATWSALHQTSSLTSPHFDGFLGREEDLVALPDGFGAVFTALAPAPLVDGEEDVVYVHAVDSSGGTP